MLELSDVTLIAVTSVRIPEAVWALGYSTRRIRFAAVKLLTHAEVAVPGVETVKVPQLDYDGYSRFIVYELHKHFTTDFVLVIQDDGYVVHPESWSSTFLEYDYIGAPWGTPHDDVAYRDRSGSIRRVGNGGFSLRSRKLCRLATELNLPWERYHGYFHEDGFICTQNVHIYEQHGCRFAPVEVAVRFSQEADVPEARGVRPFGFHGKQSRYNVRYRSLANRIRGLAGRLWRKVTGPAT